MATKDTSNILAQALKDQEFATRYGTQKLRHIEETHKEIQRDQTSLEMAFLDKYTDPKTVAQDQKDLEELKRQLDASSKHLELSQQRLMQAHVEHAETTSLRVAARIKTATTPEKLEARVRSLSKDPDEIVGLTKKYQAARYGDLGKTASQKQENLNILAEQLRAESQKQILDPALMTQLEADEQRYLAESKDKTLTSEMRAAASTNLTSTRSRISKLKDRGFTTPQMLAQHTEAIDAESRELAAIESVRRRKEKTGGSPEKVLEDAEAKLAKIEQRKKRDEPADEKALEESRKNLTAANNKYADSIKALQQMDDKSTKEADDARQKILDAEEELLKAKKENVAAEKKDVEQKRQRMAKWQAIMSIGQDAGNILGGMVGGIPFARAQLSQNIDVDLRNRQLQAQIGMGNIANERFFEQMSVMTDARAYRRMNTNRAAIENRAGLEAGNITSENITRMIDAQASGKLVDAGMNVIGNTAGGVIRGARAGMWGAVAGGVGGLGSSAVGALADPAMVNLATQYQANLMGLPQSEEAAKRIELEKQRDDVLNKSKDFAAQMSLDLRTQTAINTRGLGGGRGAAYRELTGEMGVYNAAAVGIDQQQLSSLAGIGKNVLGGDFSTKDIYRGGALAQSGILAAPEQYLQARGELSNVGGNAADFEEIMSRAVAAGLNNSKSIMQMVDATTKMSDRSSKMGVDVTSGAAGILGRAAESLSASGMAKGAIPGAAANAIEAYNNTIANKDLTLSNIFLAQQTSQRFKNASPAELAKIQDLRPEQWGQLAALNRKKDKTELRVAASRFGVPSLVGKGDAGLTAQAQEQERDTLTASNIAMSYQGIGDPNPRVQRELQNLRLHGYDPKRLKPGSELFGKVQAYFKVPIDTLTSDAFTPSTTKGEIPKTANEVDDQERQRNIDLMMKADVKRSGDKGLGTEKQMADRGAQKMLDFDPNKVAQDTASAMGEKLAIPAATFGKSVDHFWDAVTKLNDILDTYVGGMKRNKTPSILKNNIDSTLE